ncbi:type III secretion system cytoplasmic ring protein SctQ [Pararoseomonas sp. SCSIO 73927]|uniref:type III secretion system cytoplasmic ring protein SctQ n=1 Tax=Pararoseomonas sp. SCSIO 73927 TaxID=3114537 RepID=UPI0030D0D01F
MDIPAGTLHATRPWRAPRLDAEGVARHRALAAPRAPLPLPGGLALLVGAAPAEVPPGAACLRFTVGGHAASLTAAAVAFDRLLGAVDPAASGARGAGGALLLELLLEPVLGAVEAALDAPMAAVSLDAEPPVAFGPALGLTLLTAGGEVALAGRLALPAVAEARLLRALGALPPGPLPPPPWLTVPVSFRIGATEIAASDFAALRPGDGLPFDAARRGRGEALAVVGEAQGWIVRPGPRGCEALTPRRRLGAIGMEDWAAMPGDTTGPDDASVEELPVRLVFELGRLEVPVAELSAAGPGHLFPLPVDPENATVDILANGRRVGRGSIVQVGEGVLAVRVISLGRGAS